MAITAFVILHYGEWSVTRACVESIAAMQMQRQIRIVVVDNDRQSLTKDNNPAWLMSYGNLMVLVNNEGHGFSHANNLGYRYARKMLHADFIVVLNNDIVFPQADFQKRLLFSYRKHTCHVLSPAILRGSGHEPQSPMDVRLRTAGEAEYTIQANRLGLLLFPAVYPLLALQEKIARKRQLEGRHADPAYYRQTHRQIVPFGACLIFTPLFVAAEEEAFTPETEFYYEEYLLTLRCIRKNYLIVYDPVMKVLHESGSATKQAHKTNRSKMKFRLWHTMESCRIYKKELTGTDTGGEERTV